MARKYLLLFALLIMLSTIISSTHGTRLLKNARRRNDFPAVGGSLYMAALPKGTVVASAPSKKSHANTIDQKLIVARRLSAVDRILRSVPSPAVGH